MFSYSFGILKPDCYQRGFDGKVKKMILAHDLRFMIAKRLILTSKQVENVYVDSINDWYFEDHSKFMQFGPVTVFIVGGEYALQKLNDLVGYTIPSQAASHTIRRWGTDIGRNLIHSSGTFRDFIRDSQTFFKGREFDHFYEREYLP